MLKHTNHIVVLIMAGSVKRHMFDEVSVTRLLRGFLH
ncbi:Uncharacterised protein [Vibrio cholerae]|nr:Uncharacterised protein [Vibrio cholerae]